MTRMDKMVDTERIILIIQNYQCLWNSGKQDYHNKQLKEASWNSVCEDLVEDWITLGPEEKNIKLIEIKKRWNNIRDYYKKEIDQQKNVGTGHPAKKRKKYVFADILEFLRPVFEHRNTSGNHENIRQNPEDDTPSTKTTETSSISTVTTASTTSITTSPPQTVIHKKTKKATAKLNAFERSIIKALENKTTITNAPVSPREDDPDLMFLKSLLPDLKELTRSQKFYFKIGIMQLLRSIRNPGSQSSLYGHDHYYRQTYSASPGSRSPTPNTYPASHAVTRSHSPTPSSQTYGDSSNEAKSILPNMSDLNNEQYPNTKFSATDLPQASFSAHEIETNILRELTLIKNEDDP